MKTWRWDIFVISFLVSFLVAMMIAAGIFKVWSWPLMLMLALVMAAAVTFIKGLLKAVAELEKKLDEVERRLWDLSSKVK